MLIWPVIILAMFVWYYNLIIFDVVLLFRGHSFIPFIQPFDPSISIIKNYYIESTLNNTTHYDYFFYREDDHS